MKKRRVAKLSEMFLLSSAEIETEEQQWILNFV